MAKQKSVTVFYSWQSDSPKDTNSGAIRKAIGQACSKLKKTVSNFDFKQDEATRDTAGAPNIVAKILEKIEGADIFIADVTTITPAGSVRPCPNPNVSHELGFAVAHLGWERIILLFNEAHGNFPADMPFDFAQHRASPYKLEGNGNSSDLKPLSDLVTLAINAIVKINPKRPSELKGLTVEKIRHDQDFKVLKWLMSALHLPTLDSMIEAMPYHYSHKALMLSDTVNGVVANSLFHLHDQELDKAVRAFNDAWQRAFSYDQYYRQTPSGDYAFTNPGDAMLSPAKEKAWVTMMTARTELRSNLDFILARLRTHYVEIDIQKTNRKAWKAILGEKKAERQLLTKPSKKVRKRSKQKKA